MNFIRRFWPYFVFVVLVAAGGVVWTNRHYIQDWIVLRGYDVPQPIAQLATETGMSEYGERLFYVNKPELNDKIALNENCKDLIDEVSVLGCFVGDRQGIFIFDITDPRLAGIEEVTAAHEMLHQAYKRLSSDERTRINTLLADYYNSEQASQSVKDKIEIYKVTEPNDIPNEMHSIIGTEVKVLSAELEEHYKHYFEDRQKVVAFWEASQAEFEKYRKQIEDYDRRLSELRPQIESMEADLTARVADLKKTKAALEADLAAGRIGEYNAQVAPYNAKVKAYNQLLSSTNQRIEEYNKLVNERNAASVQVKELNKALDSSLKPQ
jgi:hypothetical protein